MISIKENSVKRNLDLAEQKAKELFKAVEEGGLIVPGKLERQLNGEVVELAR